MKPCAVTALFMAGISLMAGDAWARPVDLSIPTVEVGAANSFGYLEIWRQINDVGLQLGSSYLPLRYKFSSEPTIGGMLGPGFYVPMFEAKNVLIREQMMRAFLPCGKGLYLRRDLTDQNKFQTVDGVWTGYLMGDGDFTVWRDDGWKLLYHQSRLTSLTTDDNHTFTWSYGGNGMPAGVSEDGQSVVTVEPNVAGQVAAFVFNGKRYEVEYAQRPITEVLLGQVAVKELDQALSSFKYPDGKMDTFKFALTPDRIPTLTSTDKDGKQTLYAWDAATNHLVTENGAEGSWKYKIGEITQDFGQPPVTRTNSNGKSESVAVDNKAGTTTETALDGEVTVRTVFKTPGPLYDKVRQITDTPDKTTSILLRFGYDETGRLIREIDDNNFTTVYTYDAAGKVAKQIVLPPSDPAIVAKLQAREKVLLGDVAKAKTPADKDNAIRELAMFYIYRMGDIDKALGLAQGLSHPDWAYEIKMYAILGNRNLTSAERVIQLKALLTNYPQANELLLAEINIFQGDSSSPPASSSVNIHF